MVGLLGAIYAKQGRKKDSDNMLWELQTPPFTYDKKHSSCAILMASGRVDEALMILGQLVEVRHGTLVYLNAERTFYGEVAAEKLADIRKRMGFKD
jgi:hypothetical protein